MYNLFLYQSKDNYIYNLFMNIVEKDKKNIRMYGVFSDAVENLQKDVPVLHKYYYRQLLNNKLLLISESDFDLIKNFCKFSHMAIISNNPKESVNNYEKYFLRSSIDQNTKEIINVAKLLFHE